jgi:hypothetical protein
VYFIHLIGVDDVTAPPDGNNARLVAGFVLIDGDLEELPDSASQAREPRIRC